jgi:hypothetical protein
MTGIEQEPSETGQPKDSQPVSQELLSTGEPQLVANEILLNAAFDRDFDREKRGEMFQCRFRIPDEVRDLSSFMKYRSVVQNAVNARMDQLFEGRESEIGLQFKATWAINELLPNVFDHSFLGLGKDTKNAIKDDTEPERYAQAIAKATGNLNDERYNARQAEVVARWQDDGSLLLTVQDTGDWREFNQEARAEVEAFNTGNDLEVHGQNGLGVLIAFAPEAYQDPETGLITVPLKNESTT